MPWQRCETCNQDFFRDKNHQSCPNCKEVIESNVPVMSPAEQKEHLIRQAGNQARVVEKFGEVLQSIGYILIVILALGFTVSLFTENWIGIVVFLIAIPLTFVSYNVFGSALRAVALYIQVRLK